MVFISELGEMRVSGVQVDELLGAFHFQFLGLFYGVVGFLS